ncbi:PREDICTED: uncharacterized protein LOC109151335 isoform X2 [Ipomoea nil]|uniref:uncharacterized protein LOC109151335 isoform X2 n=1 Tax=Ipomoea nil TaxID=35883 RepID=UPI000901438F|nr:PREDICTED: uncharacterized protein LOC109151335 isoform X2 [Ipomoea nil]
MAYVSRFTFLLGTFSLSVFSYLLPLFCHFTSFLFRLRKGDGSLEKSFDFSEVDGAESKRESGKAENKSHKDFGFSEEKERLVTDSDSASTGFEHMSRLGDSLSDGFLSDEDFEIDSFKDLDVVIFHHPEIPDDYSGQFAGSEESDVIMEEELRELEQDHLCRFLSESDFHEDLDSGDNANRRWEHQELIQQLQSELRKVRTNSLPTILEESDESPEIIMEEDYLEEDYWKPWKNVDQSFQPQNFMADELHQFYHAYRERMRRFDILTYQNMYAIGFLQKEPLKDPLQLLSTQKSSSSLKSLLSQNIWLFKHKNRGVDPLTSFIKEVRRDLEAVYVGQMCLSWEFLHWQYVKALDLRGSDPRRIHRYDEVSEEFQQFMALMLRFMDDEPFQGTRVQHYIKCRCDFPSLLQVPLIKEDSWMEKTKANPITSDMLVEILEECIRTFWRFVKADKESSAGAVGKGQKRVHPEVRNAEDIGLLREVTKSLHKKERKLKDILRSENSTLRGFSRWKEEDTDHHHHHHHHHVLYFFSQVDMKLVSRVLNMSAITRDQLQWCHNKLSTISFQQTKIQGFERLFCGYFL